MRSNLPRIFVAAFALTLSWLLVSGTAPGLALVSAVDAAISLTVTAFMLRDILRFIPQAKARRAALFAKIATTEAATADIWRRTALTDIEITAQKAWQEF